MSQNFVTTEHKLYAPVGKCVYCQKEKPITELTDEHIIPYGLGGRLVLPKASCSRCQSATKKFEDHCLSRKFGNNRFYMGIGSRSGKTRTTVPIEIVNKKAKEIALDDLPAVLLMFHFQWIPGILLGETPTTEFAGKICVRPLRDNFNDCINKLNGKLNLTKGFKALPFGKMLAKIAHSYAVAELGIDGFKPLLNSLIQGAGPLYPAQFIGGNLIKEPVGKELHELSIGYSNDKNGRKFVEVRIHLFASYDMPVHYVVVGEALT
ncbi:MAG: HNH endonuclease [Alphaproteobacteria bacterium]|nr:HNH endonuclease [Alphaproteobacteria bacterium]